MSRITTITVTYSRTLKLADYNMVKAELTISAELAEDDDAQSVENDLWVQAKLGVVEQLRPLYKKQSEQAAAVLAGLPRELQQEILQEILDANSGTS